MREMSFKYLTGFVSSLDDAVFFTLLLFFSLYERTAITAKVTLFVFLKNSQNLLKNRNLV